MSTPQQTTLLLRSGTSVPPESVAIVPPAPAPTPANRGTFTLDPRPYLVTGKDRKVARAAQRYPALFPHEPEDARITGTTRSLYRRLLALNLPGRSMSPSATSAPAGAVAKSLSAGFKIA
jgi:hypothetical protein